MIYKLTATIFSVFIYCGCLAQTANRYDIVIGELMPDPSPIVGLPNAEYIELKNVSFTAFNLTGWKITDGTSTATITANFILQPDSILLICSNTNVSLFLSFGRTIGVSNFPSLDNDGDLISLISPPGKMIHAVEYNVGWYQNTIKSEGGWSLEMIDPKNPCAGMSNWKASNDADGGTPGRKNSIDGVNTDATPPQLKRSFATDSVTIILVFDEPLDSLSAAFAGNYTITNGSIITTAKPVVPRFSTVQLKLAVALQKGIVYTITITAVNDCKGNAIGGFNKTKIGLAQNAEQEDIVVNEILFNPKPGGYDYVEVYNQGNKILDAGKLYVANRSSTGVVSSPKKLSQFPFFIFPGEYVVLTEDAESLDQNYFIKNRDAVFTLSSLPSFPDDEGTVVLTNSQGNVIDEVNYKDDWHFGLIASAEGIALERIDPTGASQEKNNWHSAASTAGYGTPGYQNSQFRQTATGNVGIEISPKIFSPDNDGFDDIATIQYTVSETGYVANIIVFDASGRKVRHLVKNALLGLKGFWTWDGLGENGQKLPIGSYLIYTELFKLDGKKERFKNVVVLGRKLN